MKKVKPIISFILVIVLMMSSVNVSAASQVTSSESATTISVESKSVMDGESVEVNVLIQNNPGILGLTLEISYDDNLILTNASNGEAFSYLTMTKPGNYTSPCKFTWDGQEVSSEEIEDGSILTLNFTLKETAEIGEDYSVNVKAVGSAYDNDLNAIAVSTENGYIRLVDFEPGDLNADGKINVSDVILMRRYIVGGYDLSIHELAADVNNDGYINPADVIMLRRYIQGGYGVTLVVSNRKCIHEMTATAKVEATCTEDGNIAYWQCSKCEKFFSDENGTHEISEADTVVEASGHHSVVIPADPPSKDHNPGKTEGSYCDVCGEILVAQEDWYLNTYTIQYDIANGDDYIASLDIDNSSNPSMLFEGDSEYLEDLTDVKGLKFLGWFDGAGENASKVIKIENIDHNIRLYAHWKPEDYDVLFKYDSKLEGLISTDELKDVTYHVNAAKKLPVLSLPGYTFIGWSDTEGNLCDQIDIGSTGDKTYYANWMSNRNQAWESKNVSEPYIYHDENEGIILYAYEIGQIKNVPLYEIENFGGIISGGVKEKITKTIRETTQTELIDAYSTTAELATTENASWTLSDGWTDSTSINEEWCKENNITKEQAEIISKSDTGNWYVSNSAGGVKSQTVIDSNQNHNMMASTTNTKTYDTTNTTVTDMHVGETDWKAGASVEVGASFQKGIAKNRTSVSGKLTVEGSWEKKDVDTDGTVTVTNKGTDTDHTDDSLNESTNEHYASSLNTSSWNSESGYGASSTTCKSTTVAEKLSEMISEKTGYGSTYITTGDSSTTQGKTESTRESNQYSSSVSYSKIVSEETTVELNTENTMTGYHRWVMAGTAHVFGVVGYDIANKCFFTYTYSIMDDKTYRFEDFSYKTADYDDNQCSIINFEIPTDIISYVETRTYGTNGLEYDLDGNVTAYNGTDSYVVIPNYVSVDNLDGTANAVKVTAIAPDAFKNNKNITGVLLSDFITEIPENAFEGCSELWDFNGTSIESIGDNAFKDCVKLHSFNVSSDITNLGKNAFAGTDFLEVDAANSNVVSAAIESGARHIVVNLQNLSDSLDEKELVIPEGTCLFVLRGYGNSYRNLNIISHARTTKIVRLSIDSDGKIPLELYSPNITMNQCNISNAGIAMVTYENDVELGLYGEVNVETTAVNALLCKNISLNQVKDGLATKLNIDGNLVKCGNLQENDLLNVSGEIISVDEESWNNLLHSYTLSFDPAGGTCDITSMKVANSTPVGELPTPVREGFGFAGWFTAEGEQVTSETVFSGGVDITVYAHWTANSYTAVWSEPVGTTITVDRISSPNGNAEMGILSSGDIVYYGDVLAVTYTANTGFTLETKGAESITVTSDVTSNDIYASATPDTYKVSWTTGTGYSITVNRTDSPYKNASTGVLSNNDDIYFGDELSISYAAEEGYTLVSHGETNITVTGDVTSEDIKASVEANEYTYKIVYQSTNGTSLGSAEVTYKYGTTNTISAPSKSGYNTPASQTIVWDSTSPKTITFKYSPVSVSTSQQMSSGAINTWDNGKYGVTYVAHAEYRNRTSTSVQVRIKWVNTITANTYFGYGQYFTGNIAGTSTGEVTICTNSTWASSSSSSRSATAYSGWITVSAPATQRTVSLSASWRTAGGHSGSWSNTMTIPTY